MLMPSGATGSQAIDRKIRTSDPEARSCASGVIPWIANATRRKGRPIRCAIRPEPIATAHHACETPNSTRDVGIIGINATTARRFLKQISEPGLAKFLKTAPSQTAPPAVP